MGCWYAEYVAGGLKVSWNGQMVEPKTHRKAQPPPNLPLQLLGSLSASVWLSACVLTGDQKHSRNRELGSFHPLAPLAPQPPSPPAPAHRLVPSYG